MVIFFCCSPCVSVYKIYGFARDELISLWRAYGFLYFCRILHCISEHVINRLNVSFGGVTNGPETDS